MISAGATPAGWTMDDIEGVLSGRARWAVVKGDSRVMLASVPDCSIDSCVCDPPYGLGPREPTVDELVRYLQGEDTLQTGGDFMGRKWSVPSVGLWREVYRVLKPGAYLAAFSGTRTSALVEMGIRAAGFEVEMPLTWIFSTGFPKSADASKMIDKHFGAVREVVGEKVSPSGVPYSSLHGPRSGRTGGGIMGDPCEVSRVCEMATAPSTPQAQQWDGFGTALKPAHDRIILAMKPREGTIAHNLLTHGTGAMNLDGCRVATSDNLNGGAYSPDNGRASMFGLGDTGKPYTQPSGRFPPDVLLSHAEGCRRVGKRKVRNPSGPASGPTFDGASTSVARGKFNGATSPPAFYADPDGTETIDAYECVPGCPVRELNSQADDEIARFFPQFDTRANTSEDRIRSEAFLHASKASRTEREAGCEHLPPVTRTDITGRDNDSAGQNNPRAGIRQAGDIRNVHNCVKPVAVLRWLTRLLTPPGGVVLDPFCGSGSGGCSAMAEGVRYVGIELDADGFDYCAIARARIAWWQAHPGGPTPEAQEETRLEAAGQRSLF